MDFTVFSLTEGIGLLGTVLAFAVSFLTLINATKFKAGILAVATYYFGAGMVMLATAHLLQSFPEWMGAELIDFMVRFLFLLAFILLGLGSLKIFSMSKIAKS